jgi:hypothetical protein
MDRLKALAIALIVIGIAGIVYDLAGLSRNRTTIEMGSMSASVTEKGAVPVAAIVGGLALIGGIVLFINDKRRA